MNDKVRELENLLVKQEKLANIGQLTAGILHEIRNPLNFVKNFSNLSVDLLKEMNEILADFDNESCKELISEISEVAALLAENTEKVIHHANRAERIVEGMLSQARTDVKQEFEYVNFNLLVEDFVKLGYHGVKGNITGFNTAINFHYDSNIKQVKVLKEEFSRVIVNIVGNACYALFKRMERKEEGYKPELDVTTLLNDNYIVLKIRDNGTGIPQNVINKIFNAFFTTKPSGEGTGLGLSMSYEIIVKKHNGKLEVVSEENVFSEFIISIPQTIL